MLRFTVRDLLWLMVVVGLAVGWFLDHRKQASQSQRDNWNYRTVTKALEVYAKGKVRVDDVGVYIDMPSGTTVEYTRELNPDP